MTAHHTSGLTAEPQRSVVCGCRIAAHQRCARESHREETSDTLAHQRDSSPAAPLPRFVKPRSRERFSLPELRALVPQLRAVSSHLLAVIGEVRAVGGEVRAVGGQVRASFAQLRAVLRQVRALIRQLRALSGARRSRAQRETLASSEKLSRLDMRAVFPPRTARNRPNPQKGAKCPPSGRR